MVLLSLVVLLDGVVLLYGSIVPGGSIVWRGSAVLLYGLYGTVDAVELSGVAGLQVLHEEALPLLTQTLRHLDIPRV